jgi:O-antigen/teichoic acid export membrane protein
MADKLPQERRLRSDVFVMFGSKGIVTLLNVASSIVVARALGPSGRGTVAVAFALTLILVQLGTLGLTSANPYLTAQDPGRRGHLITNSLLLAIGIGVALVGVGALLKVFAPSVVKGLSWTETMLAITAIPAMLAALFLQSVLLGEGRMVSYNAGEVLLAVLLFAAQFVALVVFDAGVTGALAVTLATQVTAVIVWLRVLTRGTGRLDPPDRSLAWETLRYAFRIYMATLVAFLVIRIDMLMVNGFLGAGDAGQYSVAVALADGMYIIPAVIATNLFARVARGLGGDASAQVFRSVAVLYAGLCLISVALAAIAVRVLYGAAFSDATSLYYWLAPGVFCLGMINILAQHFAGRGFPIEAALVWIPGLILNVLMNALLLKPEGVYIASLSSSITYLLVLILHMRLFAKEQGGWSVMRPNLGEVVRFVRVAVGRTAPEAGV